MKNTIWKVGIPATTAVALLAAGNVFAGQTPYYATVGDDTAANDFYVSPKHRQFQYSGDHGGEGEAFTVRDSRGTEGRGFSARPEQCDIDGNGANGNTNQMLAAGPSGTYEWTITLPMDLRGNLNLNIQCGLLKANTEGFTVTHPMLECAGETGERFGDPGCVRLLDQPGTNPVETDWIPSLTASAFNTAANIDFNLTAYRNPSSYEFEERDDGRMSNSRSMQILDGGDQSKIALKSCFTKSIFTKIPVEGQLNRAGDEEADLFRGDTIRITMDIPRGHSNDIYCHSQSASVTGIGEPTTATGTRRGGGG